MALRLLNRVGVLLGVSVLAAGCGGGASDAPRTVRVQGEVLYQGKPVPQLSVAFIPEKGLLASGMTDDNGKFTLTTNKAGDGAAVGMYKVAIRFVPDEIPEMPGFPGAKTKPPASPIPAKYADAKTSELTQTVDEDAAKNNFTFELTD